MDSKNSLFTASTEESPLGRIDVYAGPGGLISVRLLGKSLSRVAEPNPSMGDPAGQALLQILEYLDGKRRTFDVTIDWSLIKPFQTVVLKQAMLIPYGSWKTYGQVARELGKPAASRAIGGALANNPIPIIIPCHRVAAADGSLTGFSAANGVRSKRWLLELEGNSFVGEKLA